MEVKKCKDSATLRRHLQGNIWRIGALLAVAALSVICLLPANAAAQEKPPAKLTIAAGSDLQYALKEISQEFERQNGAEVTVIYGASGNLFKQIQSGAPYDVFLSADMDHPRKLVSLHLADPNSLYRYAVGRLVLWVPRNSSIDVKKGMDVLLDPAVSKIAVSNPKAAAYGRAAVAALRHYQLYSKLQPKLVMAESVTQVEQLVKSDSAQIGMLSLSYVFAPTLKDSGSYYEIPSEAYPTIDEGAVILAKSANKDMAQQFMAFLKRPETVQILKKYGYVEPISLGR